MLDDLVFDIWIFFMVLAYIKIVKTGYLKIRENERRKRRDERAD